MDEWWVAKGMDGRIVIVVTYTVSAGKQHQYVDCMVCGCSICGSCVWYTSRHKHGPQSYERCAE